MRKALSKWLLIVIVVSTVVGCKKDGELDNGVVKDLSARVDALKSSLRRNKYQPRTFTFDNDKAFSCHELVAQHTHTKTYFTRPYTSQDKGAVENRIGVIRRFFPKKTNLTFVTDEQVREVENKINNRPIRKFNYQNANQVLRNKIALIT